VVPTRSPSIDVSPATSVSLVPKLPHASIGSYLQHDSPILIDDTVCDEEAPDCLHGRFTAEEKGKGKASEDGSPKTGMLG
jgi:hypothetical protein